MKKIQGIEFRDGELLELALEGKYIVKYNTIFLARYSQNAGARLEKVWRNYGDLPLTKRGRFHVMDFQQVNSLVGFELLVA